jgi:hypothetical protein
MKNNPSVQFNDLASLNVAGFNEGVGKQVKNYFSELNKYYSGLYNKSNGQKEKIIASLQWPSPDALKKLRDEFFNESLDDLLKNAAEQKQIEEVDSRLIQRFQPVFMDGSRESFIRAPFFVSRKHAFGNFYETFWVNIIVIWCMTAFAALALYFDWLKKFLKLGEKTSFKFKK